MSVIAVLLRLMITVLCVKTAQNTLWWLKVSVNVGYQVLLRFRVYFMNFLPVVGKVKMVYLGFTIN